MNVNTENKTFSFFRVFFRLRNPSTERGSNRISTHMEDHNSVPDASEAKRIKTEETPAADLPHQIAEPEPQQQNSNVPHATDGVVKEQTQQKMERPKYPKKMVVLLLSYLGEKYHGLQRYVSQIVHSILSIVPFFDFGFELVVPFRTPYSL
jgi:hypothetical protein